MLWIYVASTDNKSKDLWLKGEVLSNLAGPTWWTGSDKTGAAARNRSAQTSLPNRVLMNETLKTKQTKFELLKIIKIENSHLKKKNILDLLQSWRNVSSSK
jgi:hypothetical protein